MSGFLLPGEFFPHSWTGPQNPSLQGLFSSVVPHTRYGELEKACGTAQGKKHVILPVGSPVPEACACHTVQCGACPHHLVVWDRAQPIPLRPEMQPPLTKCFIFKLWAVLCMPDLGSWAHAEEGAELVFS